MNKKTWNIIAEVLRFLLALAAGMGGSQVLG